MAYVVHLSVLSRQRTDALLAEANLNAEVAALSVVPMPETLRDSLDQIRQVEQLSDAYHLDTGGDGAVVAYLLRTTWADRDDPAPAPPSR